MDGHFTARSTVVEGWVKDALDFWKQNRSDDEESTRITNVYKNSNNKNKGFGTTGKKKEGVSKQAHPLFISDTVRQFVYAAISRIGDLKNSLFIP